MALQAMNTRAAGRTHHTAFEAATRPVISRSCSVRARAQHQKTEQAVAATSTEYVEGSSALGKRALLAAAAATVTATTAGCVEGSLSGVVLQEARGRPGTAAAAAAVVLLLYSHLQRSFLARQLCRL
jgi:lysozyme family protein